MDFGVYTNIEQKVKELGGIKSSVFNKKIFEAANEYWNNLSDTDKMTINNEILTAPMFYKTIVTSCAICIYNSKSFVIIPIKDIMWIYNNIFTQCMYFIPYNKTHTLFLVDRYNRSYTIGVKNTGGFSKKNPNEEIIIKLRELLYPKRNGIVFGYNPEIANLFSKNFSEAVRMVDEKSQVQN